MSFSRGSAQPRDQTHLSCLAGRFFTTEPMEANGILLSHKRNENFAICNNMDGLGGYYAKLNIRKIQLQYDITYMWILKCTTN